MTPIFPETNAIERDVAVAAPAAQSQPARDGARARPTIGFLTANIHVGVSRRLWQGVVDAAEALDANLICYPGGVINAANNFESQRNAIYALANPEMVDGVVNWSSTITGVGTVAVSSSDALLDGASEAAHALFARFAHLPTVSLTQPQPGAQTVSVDSYAGMRAIMRHLIDVHHYRRIAFICGPSEHYYAQERLRAYLDALEEHGLPVVPELISSNYSFLLEEGERAVAEMLDVRGLAAGRDLDAIAAVSDLLALGALKALRLREIAVPGEVALVGFNDSIEPRLATPPLTSVGMPFHQQGALAVETLLQRLDGVVSDPVTMLQSNLVVRQSCGCKAQAIEHAAIGPLAEIEFEERTGIWQEMARRINLEFPLSGTRVAEIEVRQQQVVEALRDDLAGANGRFLTVLEAALNWIAAGDESIRRWQDLLSVMRRCLMPALEVASRSRAEDLFGQGRVLVSEIAQRTLAVRQLREERQTAILREIGQRLITTVDVAALGDILFESLPQLEIPACFLALYATAGPPAAGVQPMPFSHARLEIGYCDGKRFETEAERSIYPSDNLLPKGLLPSSRRFTLIVEPLFFRESQMGFVLFEAGPRDTAVYEVLRGYISSALKGALLVREAVQARSAAEKADQIKTRLLANVSHELRTPLHIILENAGAMLESWTLPQELHGSARHIQQSAEHQLRLINDLLDLSRAEIDELDLYPVLIDPHPLLSDTFGSLAPVTLVSMAANGDSVRWQLALPDRLPLILADPLRLRQVLLNLLANAQKYTTRGNITLGAEVAPPYLHLWVADSGAGIASEQLEEIFDPFVTGDQHPSHLRQPELRGGIGLGLSISRQLIALHKGTIKVEAAPTGGTIFHIYLPLPALGEPSSSKAVASDPLLVVISTAESLPREIVDFSARQGLTPLQVRGDSDVEGLLAGAQPAGLAWDMAGATSGEWRILRRLRQHPRLASLPFLLYGQQSGGNSAGDAQDAPLEMGLTSFVNKNAGLDLLLENLRAALATESTGTVLIVDDDPRVRKRHSELVATALPELVIQSASDGEIAIRWMEEQLAAGEQPPSLVLLDLMMPGVEGVDVLDWMRADPRLRKVPVLVLSSRLLTLDDVRRLEHHANVIFQSKGVLTDAETIETVRRVLQADSALPVYTSALVKHAVAFLHQNYARAIARWELAEAAGVSEDYLSRVFNREIGLSPWEYLNRYRIWHARELLERTNDGVNAVARQVGFHDQRYFARVFRKVTGASPLEYRERALRRDLPSE